MEQEDKDQMLNDGMFVNWQTGEVQKDKPAYNNTNTYVADYQGEPARKANKNILQNQGEAVNTQEDTDKATTTDEMPITNGLLARLRERRNKTKQDKRNAEVQYTAPEPTGEENSLERLYTTLNSNPQLTQEQLDKLAKREKAEKAIAALGDIGSNIANIVGAGKGAAPMKLNADNSMSKIYKDKWDAWRKQYKDNADAYNSDLLTARKYDIATKAKADQAASNLEIARKKVENRMRELDVRMAKIETEGQLRAAKVAYQNALTEYTNNKSDFTASEIAIKEKQLDLYKQKLDFAIRKHNDMMRGTTVTRNTTIVDGLGDEHDITTTTRTKHN